MNLILIAAGGALGAVARYIAGAQTSRLLGSSWPYGTLFVNLLGGLLMGLLAAWVASRTGAERMSFLLGVGFLGGFTTFSAFSLELVLMIERRVFAPAAAYALTSVVLSCGALILGLWLGRRSLG